MKAYSVVVALALVSLSSCANRTYSDEELRSLLVGSWRTSTSFETNAATTRILLKSSGSAMFNGDGPVIFETDTSVKIGVPEGQLPLSYHALVRGKWFVAGQSLHTSRISEEITAKDDVSRKFIESDRMKKLRSESPTEFVYALTVSSRKIVAVESDGSRTTYTREK